LHVDVVLLLCALTSAFSVGSCHYLVTGDMVTVLIILECSTATLLKHLDNIRIICAMSWLL